MALDLQRVFESLVIPFLNNCPGTETGHVYGTRKALGKLATPSKRHCREDERTPSISSSESFASLSLATARPPQRRRYPKRVLTKSTTNRAQTRSTSQEWSDVEEERQSLMDEEESGGRRSISVDVSLSSEELLPSVSAPRRETRSMAKRRSRTRAHNRESSYKVGGVVASYSRENGFGMTLRTRGTKRQLEDESGSEDSGSEMEDNDQEDESESEAESLDVEQEDDEEEEEEEAESVTSSLRTRSSRLRVLGASKAQRKRPRRSSDSDEDLTYKPSKFLTRSSRSGRLVKANTKYS